MRNVRLLIGIIVFSCFWSCSNQEDALINNDLKKLTVIILQERDKNYPFTNYENLKPKHIVTRSSDLALSNFVGRSYKLEHYPFENAQNLGFPVIDMDKYIADHPEHYQSTPIKESYSEYESFSGFERYEKKIQKTKTVSTGFQLDFKVFKIGSKKNYKNVFKCTDTQIEQNVFGELLIKFYDRKYELLIPANIRKDIYRNYMHKDFVDQLYYSSTDELIKYYGGFLLTKFLSGGQATALYSGMYIENSHDEDNQRESYFNTEISASVDVTQSGQSKQSITTRSNDGLPYQSVLIGRTPGSYMSYTNKFQNIEFSLRTLGGLPAYSQFTVPKDINSLVFDISAWSKSLENASSLTIAELTQESLIPISDFIEEDNLKEALYAYYENGANSEITYIKEPHIKLRMIFYNQQFAIWETSLFTRYGEYIRLRTATMQPLQATDYLYQEAARVSTLFPNLRIEGIPNYYQVGGNHNADISDDQNQFDISNMSKFIDSATGKIYLLTTVPQTGEKLAYTLYDNHIINDYVLENLINGLPVNNNVSLTSIRSQYRLIAL